MTAFAPLLGLLAEVPDPRRGQGQLYKLPHVLLFSILAIVTGCNSYRGIVTFIDVHRHKLNATFGLRWRRAPAYTAVRYILKGLDPADVEVAFRRHATLLQAARATPGKGSIAIDGQNASGELRQLPRPCRHSGAQRFCHRYVPRARPCRCRREIQRDPGGTDAARRTRHRRRRHRHARRVALPKKHFEVAGEVGIALIVQVKDNQPTLHQQIEQLAATAAPITAAHSRDTGRNRDERRSVSVFAPADKFVGSDWQPFVATVIRVEREVFTRNSKTGLLRHTAETAFYISNMPVAAARAAEAIRAHWGIETTSNYSRDVTFAEDRSRIRTNPGVFARLRSFGFNILKANRTDTLSQDRYRAALAGIEKLGSLVAISQR